MTIFFVYSNAQSENLLTDDSFQIHYVNCNRKEVRPVTCMMEKITLSEPTSYVIALAEDIAVCKLIGLSNIKLIEF